MTSYKCSVYLDVPLHVGLWNAWLQMSLCVFNSPGLQKGNDWAHVPVASHSKTHQLMVIYFQMHFILLHYQELGCPIQEGRGGMGKQMDYLGEKKWDHLARGTPQRRVRSYRSFLQQAGLHPSDTSLGPRLPNPLLQSNRDGENFCTENTKLLST